MRQVGDAAGLYVRYRAGVEQLDYEPKANQKRSWDEGHADEYKDDQKPTNLVSRVGNDESPHYGSDGAAGAQSRNVRAGAASHLCQHCHEASEQIKRQIARGVHGVFHLRAKCPEEEHVAYDVHPTAVHEHRGENGDPVMACDEVRRDCGPLLYKGLAAQQLAEENKAVGDDDEQSHHREARWAP